MRERWHIYFEGRVQGVGFRYTAAFMARSLKLSGWVKNLWDGRVEMEVQGDVSAIRRMLIRLKGERYIRIEHMEIEQIPLEDSERVFQVH